MHKEFSHSILLIFLCAVYFLTIPFQLFTSVVQELGTILMNFCRAPFFQKNSMEANSSQETNMTLLSPFQSLRITW